MKDKQILAVAEAIRYHLYRWPDAVATSADIAQTWIPASNIVGHDVVLAALVQLEAQGFIERRHGHDTLTWALHRSQGDNSRT